MKKMPGHSSCSLSAGNKFLIGEGGFEAAAMTGKEFWSVKMTYKGVDQSGFHCFESSPGATNARKLEFKSEKPLDLVIGREYDIQMITE